MGNVEQFVYRAEFPTAIGGVLEVTDLSKRDRHEPSGRLRWLDWRVDHIHEESCLFTTLPKGESSTQRPLFSECSHDVSAPAITQAALQGAHRSLKKTHATASR